MRIIIASIFTAAGLVVAGCSDKPAATPSAAPVATAANMPAEAKSKCGTCHAIDHKIVGPAWNDVAAKYKGDQDAVNKIAASIAKGGDLGWNMGGMPAKGGSGWDDAQIKSIAEFIAGLAK